MCVRKRERERERETNRDNVSSLVWLKQLQFVKRLKQSLRVMIIDEIETRILRRPTHTHTNTLIRVTSGDGQSMTEDSNKLGTVLRWLCINSRHSSTVWFLDMPTHIRALGFAIPRDDGRGSVTTQTLRAHCTSLTKWLTWELTIWLSVDA